MRRENIISVALLFAVVSIINFGANATLLPVVTGKFYTPHGGTPANVINTSQTSYASSDVSSPDIDLMKKGVLKLGIDHHHTSLVAEHQTVVGLSIKKWSTLSGGFTTQTTSLTIDYKPNTQLSFNEAKLFEVDNVLKYEVTITSITVNSVSQNSLPANVYLELGLVVNRLYDFGSEVSGTVSLDPFDSGKLIDKDCDGIYDELLIEWTPIDGAEEYQLEWTFVNDYTAQNGVYKDDSEIEFDFKRNSTRILTADDHYSISLIYPHGYIIYRIRAVGRLASVPTKRVFTQWSTPEEGNVEDDANDYYWNQDEWEVEKNWQYSATFAEEGKRKEVVSFFDGTLRSRQMVTVMNSVSNNRAIVGETIYDHVGRPAVQVLPAPVLTTSCTPATVKGTLKYYKDFNLNMTSEAYSKIDIQTGAECDVAVSPMKPTSGASLYYSGNNSDIGEAQAYVADANKYPFSQTQYTPDNTGRIKQQGGVGETFQLNGGHATNYYYAHPSQLELDRMFGSEVGDATHYQKNMVVDANGQVSVSYLDQEGRVIATALAGASPDNMVALLSQSGSSVTMDESLFSPSTNSNVLANNGMSKVFNATIAVSAETDVIFDYAIMVDKFEDDCLEEGICFDCLYDLTIEVTDECGESMIPVTEDFNGKLTGRFTMIEDSIVFSLTCTPSTFQNGSNTFTIENMPIGTYQVSKTLTVNEGALSFYQNAYMDTNINKCFKTLEDFQLEFLEAADFSGCTEDPSDCAACVEALGTEANFISNGYGSAADYAQLVADCELPCQPVTIAGSMRTLMLGDVSPGGQYGGYLGSGVVQTENYPLSVFNALCQLPNMPSSGPAWQSPKYDNGTSYDTKYFDSDLQTESKVQLLNVVLDGSGDIASSQPSVVDEGNFTYDSATDTYWTVAENLLNVADFIANFKSSWAHSLLYYHPEFYYLKTYLQLEEEFSGTSSESFDQKMELANTWQEAIDLKLIKSGYASISTVEDRLEDYSTIPTPNTLHAFDPFVVSSSASTQGWSSYNVPFTSKLNNYQNIGATWYHAVEIAAAMARCPTVGATPSSNCYLFGGNATGSGSGGTSSADTAARDADWLNFRSIYRSLKQQYIFEMAEDRAINNSSYFGYNGCIGNTNFDPTDSEFLTGSGGQFINPDQPCYVATANLYKYKVRRFIKPGSSILTSGDAISTTDPYDAYDEAAAIAYNLTGNCPVSSSLSALVNDLIENDHHDDASYTLSNSDFFLGYLLSQNLITTPISALPGWTWEANISGDTLDAEIKNGSTLIGQIEIVQQGTPIPWTAVPVMLDFTATGTGGYGYEFSARFIDGDDTTEIFGSTSIDILNCYFPAPCTLNSLGSDLRSLMNVMVGSNLMSTTPVTIYGSGSSSPDSLLVTAEMLNTLNPVSNPTSVTWVYNTTEGSIDIAGAGGKIIRLDVVGTNPSSFTPGLIASFPVVEVINSSRMKVFGYDSGGSPYVEITVDADLVTPGTTNIVQNLTIGECKEDITLGCDYQAVVNVEELMALLNDVLVNQTASYDLYESAFMTGNLASQFDQSTTTTYSFDRTIIICDDGHSLGTNVLSQTNSVVGSSIKTITKYLVVTETALKTYTDSTLCDLDGLNCNSWLDSVIVARSCETINQTTIKLKECDLILDMNISSGELDDIVEVTELIPTGEADANGNYYEFSLVVELPSSAVDTLHGSICIPLRLCDEITPIAFPNISLPVDTFINPCVQSIVNLALANAQNAYDAYVDSLLTEFRSTYISHCMNAVENFSREYNQSEYHHTLYYYDQAGNLVKTIPPEGVELLPITSSTDPLSLSIANDRLNGTQTVLTSHRMETRYLYNSLNQLIAQHMPDMDDMSSWSQTLSNGLDSKLNTTAIQMLSTANGYLTGFVANSNSPSGMRGYLYKTTDGGVNWTRVTNLFAYDLLRVRMASSTAGFAVGKSGVALRTLDGGATWDLLNMHSKGVVGDFVDVAVESATKCAFLLSNGRIVSYNAGTLGNEYTPSAPTSVTGTPVLRLGNSITYNGSANNYAVNLEFVEGTSPDTLRFTQMAIVNVSTLTTTYQTINGTQWNAIMYPTATLGVVAGPDGDVLFLNETNSSGTGTAFLQSSDVVGNIVEIAFLNKNTGVAIIDNSGTKSFYRTFNGGINWEKVITTNASTMTVASQNSTNMYVLVSYTDNNVRYYDVASSSITLKWTHSAGYTFDKITSFTLSTQYVYCGITSGLTAYFGYPFTLTGTNAPTSISAYHTYTTGTSAVSLKAIVKSGKYHVIANMSSGVVLDACDATGLVVQYTISPSSTKFNDILIESGGAYLLGYELINQKIHRMPLTGSPPATGSLAPISISPSNLPSGAEIVGMALHNNFVSLVGSTGKIYSSTTQVTSTSSTNLSWEDRSNIRVVPMRSGSVISFTNSSVNYNAVAVGDRGSALRRTTGNIWRVYPLGLTSSMGLGQPSITPNLRGVATAVVSSINYAIIVGEQATDTRLNLNTDTKTNLNTGTYIAGSAPMFSDVAINTSGNTVITSQNGKAFYNSNVHSGTTFTQINTTASSLFGASMIPGTANAIIVGNSGIVGTLTSSTFTQTTGVFGPRLNSVHFSPSLTTRGTVVGENFFVRSTSDGGANWSRTLPQTINSTNLTKNVTDVWTRPTASNAHYAILGGPSYLSFSYLNVATPDATFNALGLNVNDIQFTTVNPNIGYIAAGTYLKKIELTVSGPSYSSSITNGLSAPVTSNINAIHVFTNGSNTSELMLVGNNMIGYKQEGSNSTISLLTGLTGNIKDVYFSDRNHGFVVGDGGIFYKTDNITYNTSGTAYTAMSWEQVNVSDAFTGTLSNINIQAIDFPSLTQGVWGGYYTTDPGSSYAAVRILNMQDQIYSSRFYYDRLGRIVVSQNSRQKGQNKFSYTLYDGLGRVTEAGEKTENTAGGGAPFFASVFGTSVGGQYIASVIDDTKLNTWITTQSGTTRKEVTRSFYDKTDTDINGNGLSGYDASFFNGATQRKRIVHVTYEENFDVDGSGNPLDATYDHATHYNYDIHGNVTTMLQDNKVLGALTNLSAQRFKKLAYVFDLISGNVHRVDYQTGKADQWHHYYQYDADNRIVEAYTTKATPFADPQYGMLEVLVEPTLSPYWKREAEYVYYDHGPLARTVLGNEEVQGLDYTYTLQGWIKGVNSNNLDVANDPGKDGNTSSSNHAVARDVMGYSLHYYTGDYAAIGGSNSFLATQTGSDLVSNSSDLYNGNIARMVTTITNPNTRAVLPLGNAYRYDQLNRLNTALSFTNLSSNAWGTGGTGIYLNTFSYDANGNITKQYRKNSSGAEVDSLHYSYQKNSANKTIRNRLYHVDDKLSLTGTFSDDIDDMGSFVGNGTINTANNYSYDAEGRLIKDTQEQIASIDWRVDGKVKAINRTGGSSKKNLKFDYDAMGNRIAKHVLTSANVLESSTYYILDAQGNVMSTYEREIISASIYYSQKERYIYGSSRLGVMSEIIPLYGSQNSTYSQAVWNDTIGRRSYELSNHLGNVLSVISDIVEPVDSNSDQVVDYFLVSIRSATDYSPFGVQLENRNFLEAGLAEDYRTGFQGQEEDDEAKGDGNSVNYKFRMHDPRLGRFFAVDPLAAKFAWNSPYAFSENKVIAWGELEGLESYYAADGSFLGQVGDDKTIRVVNDDYIESAKTAIPWANSGEGFSIDYSESLLKNSQRAYRKNEVWDLIKTWGQENTPKSINQEYAMMLFENNFTDKDGNEFKVVMPGTTVTDGQKESSTPENSLLIIGEVKAGRVNGSYKSVDGWEKYGMVHTHPSGSEERKEFSLGDYFKSLTYDIPVFMFQYDSKSLYKFQPYLYNKFSSKKFDKSLFMHSEDELDDNAIDKASFEYQNVLK